MAAWHSLSGYLIYRPHGRLGRLQSRKRWFVFEEGRCQLLLFKTEDDANQKPPLGSIDIKGAAISLSLEESNQFIIHSRGKCHILLAENHEAMMIWLLALQAKRDAVNNSFSPSIVENGCISRCEEAEKRKESLPLNMVGITLQERLTDLSKASHDLGRLDAIYDVAKIAYSEHLDYLHTEAIFEEYLCNKMMKMRDKMCLRLMGYIPEIVNPYPAYNMRLPGNIDLNINQLNDAFLYKRNSFGKSNNPSIPKSIASIGRKFPCHFLCCKPHKK